MRLGVFLLALMFANLAVLPSAAVAKFAAPVENEQADVDLLQAFLQTLPATFRVDGVNPDESTYFGTADMSFDWTTGIAHITWQVGAGTFQGSGPIDQGRFVIDWGEENPAIYTVTPDLSLDGTWADGRASERLTALR